MAPGNARSGPRQGQKGPDLKRFMDKRLRLSLNGNRKVVGTLRGYDAFLNVVLEETIDDLNKDEIGTIVIRGNSISQFETLERLDRK
mmetsp:Transcript_4667/g.4415  ORF Transcript_4667/g.4415 Transcript_4667/m.4415 type:complete len:87 (-) Transcript_4667:458-718(-)|eukprot:CAMPEP_0197831960 /NCGR_PEP_ID=MMETSP1437-20131217/12871_1 /TAXON_ID=49252 ORGANISM="Eucampia antarctica, Strain CCMP1452" /NCGR_SAMPLE_ID=MMETSP1437 /ASSEMBLY_ACC=CAM_ASM_001096 /LENGTH=86 /DNA_ID=CAMNT_0043435115 /DNA_START=56 /DNA_END=316 /DNA_ORIENTATION=-